jgi:tRNA-modifying protein YgfZ
VSDPFVFDVERDVVVVAGPDSTSFLQSLVSQDLAPVAVGVTVHSLLLQPQGKLVADFRAAHAAADVWWLVCDAGCGPALADGLSRFKIRVDATISNEPEAFGAFVTTETLDAVNGCVSFQTPLGTEVVGRTTDVVAARTTIAARALDARAFERLRIEAGVPRMGIDIDDRTIPQEAGLDVDAVSFTKGCFLGQELVCRIDTRGHVNRHLRLLRARADDATLSTGAEVVFEGRVVGTLTSAIDGVGMGFLRREVEPGAVVKVGENEAVVAAVLSG